MWGRWQAARAGIECLARRAILIIRTAQQSTKRYAAPRSVSSNLALVAGSRSR
jgi:hypothetical protein